MYMIVGTTICTSADYWSSGSWTRKVQVAELDVPATLKLEQGQTVQYQAKARACQRMTVSGWTICRLWRQPTTHNIDLTSFYDAASMRDDADPRQEKDNASPLKIRSPQSNLEVSEAGGRQKPE
jgi:hypothetical protein